MLNFVICLAYRTAILSTISQDLDMPPVGPSQIPDDYFQALVDESAFSFLESILRQTSDYVSEKFPDLTNYAPYWPSTYLMGFIRITTSDFVSSDEEIENSEICKTISEMTDALGKEKVYKLLANDIALIQSANDFFQNLEYSRKQLYKE